MNSIVIVYIPHTVEYTPDVQFSSLEYVSVPINESKIETISMNAMKSNLNMNCGTARETAEKLNQHIMKDDLILLASEEKSSLRRSCSFLEDEDHAALDSDTNPLSYVPISNEIILEVSSSSFDEGIGLSNTEESSDDQASAKSDSLAANNSVKIPAAKGYQRKQSKDKLKNYKCEICHQVFMMKKHLREHHVIEHPGENCNKCTICEKTFKLRSNLRQHLRIHTGERPFRCDICGKTFVQGSALTVHRELHKEQRDYECSVCKKAFKSKFAFKKHEKVHIGLRPFKCDECGKSFTQSCNLKAHQKLHTGNHAYHCTTCSKTFRFKSHYQDHLMTHTKEKKYCCTQCGRTFAYKNSFQRHTLIHRDEAQHQCMGCGKQFSKLSHLTFHYKSQGCARKLAREGEVDRASKILTCDICNSVFERDDTLLAHRNELHSCEENVHEKGRCRYKCVICSKSFQEERELRTHFKLHEADDCPFQCGMCGILNLNHT
ncbi:zinc finger protein 813-like isoform X2 [Anopheles merus]|uniref:zinc finger protein 813-like isoform X2 n=1 Tax=Anopheles merus TaxID=30066 RepID=UPI001BE3FA9F|nr:zinc finger protein 813-like isoform X2 [Anopheles merus]